MALTYRRMDLFKGDERALAHGCNMQGRFGRGFAKAVSERYPEAFAAYRAAHEAGRLRLGLIVPWVGPERAVLNMITQDRYGRGERFVDYDAVRECFGMVERGARRHIERREGFFFEDPRLAIPRIGADRGGGDWDVIAAIIAEEVRSVEVVVYSL